MKFHKRIPLYPLLLGIYPPLALLANNIDQIQAIIALRTLVLSLIGAGVLLLLAYATLHRWSRAALLTAWLILLFTTYGQVYDFLERHPLGGFLLGRHTYLLPVWLVLLVLGGWLVLKKVRHPENATAPLNLITLALVLLASGQIFFFQAHTASLLHKASPRTQTAGEYSLPAGETAPDIYYIILDGYGRDDDLLNTFGLDNSAFLNELEGMGFYVARCAQSNYAQTELSLSSSLNYNYLDTLGVSLTPGDHDRSALWPLLKHSAIRQNLEGLGYRIVTFETGYSWLDWEDADYFFVSPQVNEMNSFLGQGGMNNYEILYLRSTLALAGLDLGQKMALPNVLTEQAENPNRMHRERILFTLEKLEAGGISSIQSPKFVYAHIVLPHAPYVFAPDGSYTHLEESDPQGYINQVLYINQRIITILQNIIQTSSTLPVILIQGDHGSGLSSPTGRMQILSAYYLPGNGRTLLYDSISPVNSFRLVLDAYFDASLELLPDESYYSHYDDPYDFTLMPEKRPTCQGK
jgi:hypothetical protein